MSLGSLPFILTRPKGKRRPALLSSPHSGTELLPGLAARMRPEALELPDTDWLVHELYSFANELGMTTIQARYSRFVIDLNRDPAGQSLYKDGRQETSLVPVKAFSGAPIYRDGQEPDAHDVASRLESVFEPYHRAVRDELEELRREAGNVFFFDAHSIARLVTTIRPTPFPDLILGDQKGKTAAPAVSKAALNALKANGGFDVRYNDPFMGGYLTRHFGRPESGLHALQLEMSQDLYLTDDRRRIDPTKRGQLRPALQALLTDAMEAVESL